MNNAFCYHQLGGAARPVRAYARWLGFALRVLTRRRGDGPLAARLLWAEDEEAALLAAGFPSVIAVPAPLFADTAALFPARYRLAAANRDEEALLADIRVLEASFSLRFDWDAFLAACERRERRARFLRTLAEKIAALAPDRIETRRADTALRSLLRGKE